MITSYCIRFDTVQPGGPSPHIYNPQEYGWPSYTPRHWVPFLSRPMTRRAMVEVFDPASTWDIQIWDQFRFPVYSLWGGHDRKHCLQQFLCCWVCNHYRGYVNWLPWKYVYRAFCGNSHLSGSTISSFRHHVTIHQFFYSTVFFSNLSPMYALFLTLMVSNCHWLEC
jgi:hypothetical protein